MNIKPIIPIIVFLAFLGTACDNDEFFELTNPIEAPWLNATEFDAAAIGGYYALTGNGGNRAMMAHRRMASDFTADIGVFIPEAAGGSDFISVYEREKTEISMFSSAIFRPAYATIGFANGAIDFYLENDGDPYPFDPNRSQVERIIGEMYFLRGFAYWNLAKVYAPPFDESTTNLATELPVRLTSATSLEAALDAELFTVGQLYEQILTDLRTAKDKLPERFDPALGHPETYGKGRVNKFAAAAMLSRVLFQMGQFSEAKAECDFVIDQNGGDYTLNEDPIEAFNKFDDGRGSETIWYYNIGAPGSDGLRQGSNWKVPRRFANYNWTDRQSWNQPNSRDRTFAASDAFLLQAGWMNADLSETPEAKFDKRYNQLWQRVEAGEEPRFSEITRPRVWCDKYYRGPRSDESNVVMFRLAEVVLTRAIIRFDEGDAAGAASDLDLIRARAWDTDSAGTAYTPLSPGEVTAELIHTERAIELGFEGDRRDYLQALRLNIPNGDRGPGDIPWNDPSLFSDIPEGEKERNQAFSGN